MPPHPMRDLAKERRWRGIIAKWQASGISMTEFCRRNDVLYRDFSNWRRIIRVRDLEPEAPTKNYSREKKKAMQGKTAGWPTRRHGTWFYCNVHHAATAFATGSSGVRCSSNSGEFRDRSWRERRTGSSAAGRNYFATESRMLFEFSVVFSLSSGETLMFNLSSSVRIFVCTKPVDMRYSFNGLFGLAQSMICQDPYSGALFLFRSRPRQLHQNLLVGCRWLGNIC